MIESRPAELCDRCVRRLAVGRREWEKAIRRRRPWEKAIGEELTATDLAVACILAMYGNWSDGTRCHPGVENLALGVSRSSRAVIRSLGTLTEYGWFTIVSHGGWVKERADEYRLSVPAPVAETMGLWDVAEHGPLWLEWPPGLSPLAKRRAVGDTGVTYKLLVVSDTGGTYKNSRGAAVCDTGDRVEGAVCDTESAVCDTGVTPPLDKSPQEHVNHHGAASRRHARAGKTTDPVADSFAWMFGRNPPAILPASEPTNCVECDEHGWVVGSDGLPVEPARKCRHPVTVNGMPMVVDAEIIRLPTQDQRRQEGT